MIVIPDDTWGWVDSSAFLLILFCAGGHTRLTSSHELNQEISRDHSWTMTIPAQQCLSVAIAGVVALLKKLEQRVSMVPKPRFFGRLPMTVGLASRALPGLLINQAICLTLILR
jgi:hypothetical protein